MNYGKYVKVNKDLFGRLERLSDRIHFAMRSVSTPALSLEEVITLFNGAYMKKPEPRKNPKQIVIAWCEAEKECIIGEWYFERDPIHGDPEKLSAETSPDTSIPDGLITKIESWAMLEALKVIKIFEEIDALPWTVLRLTPESIHRLIEDTRV